MGYISSTTERRPSVINSTLHADLHHFSAALVVRESDIGQLARTCCGICRDDVDSITHAGYAVMTWIQSLMPS